MERHDIRMLSVRPRTIALIVTLLSLLVLLNGPASRAAEPEKILIQNVTLINEDDKAEEVVVNLLIQDKKLEVVTKDEIPTDGVHLAFDARKGYLLGKLTQGQSPSFMILDEDPRGNIQVLLDTDTHARFAMQEGIIVRNRLNRAKDVYHKEKQKGWFAYSPPPVSLPVGYESGSRWNQWKTKWVNGILIGALVLDSQYWPHQNADSEKQVGDLDDYEGGEIRALRIGALGTFNFKNPWVYTLWAATRAYDQEYDSEEDNAITLYDWRLDIPLRENTSLSLGKQKELISMERIASLTYLPWQERSSAADAFLPARNVGITLSGTGFSQRITWAGGVYNNWIDDGGSFDKNTNNYLGRITWLPWVRDNEDALLHIGLGLRYDDAREDVRYKVGPEIYKAPIFADTGVMEAGGAITSTTEISYRMGPVWLGSEYIHSWVDAPDLGNPEFDGYHISLSWILTGEMRSYSRKNGSFGPYPVAKSVYQGGAGAWETAVRWSSLDLADGTVDGGEMDILSVGLNWWLASFFMTSVNYRHIMLDKDGLDGISDGINLRITLILE